jgi:hypothetical protein
MVKLEKLLGAVLFAFTFLVGTIAAGQEVFIGNPGKSLNFFHFDLAIERGFFKELGLDVKLLSTKCDIAVTALLTGDLQATGCVGSASRFIASQNVPTRDSRSWSKRSARPSVRTSIFRPNDWWITGCFEKCKRSWVLSRKESKT